MISFDQRPDIPYESSGKPVCHTLVKLFHYRDRVGDLAKPLRSVGHGRRLVPLTVKKNYWSASGSSSSPGGPSRMRSLAFTASISTHVIRIMTMVAEKISGVRNEL